MAGYPSSLGSPPGSPGFQQTEAEECAALQQALENQRAHCAQLQDALVQTAAEKRAAHEAGLAGIRAAKAQMQQLRDELDAVKRWKINNIEAPAAQGPLHDLVPDEDPVEDDHELKLRAKELQQHLRNARHELSKWKHQVDLIEAKRPKQEDEIAHLKAELTNTLDILSSTQHAVKHHEVEREFMAQETFNADGEAVPLHGGGHGCVEAKAERLVRESIEDKNISLSAKSKRLGGVVAAQQLLIQRLEQEVLSEEQSLEKKDDQLLVQDTKMAQLRTLVRKHANAHVASVMGVAAVQPNRRKAQASPFASQELSKSSSAPRLLPPI